ncbi:hypothetical protein EHF33_19870 (plasmid) [Deinococcus psychrotolerans]|uniref:Uncharacterized protein n=1 Tax=Deinococcus psychrotolerans TaxID=2489213 RepID=A0A3G8YIU9_9DEIO|nr:hypothetical protein [Deinococcus psychrotolerans]AZI45172.1 hypothetical protein EHF33_19870 [Deinococcus psychrotolerans]
MRDLLITAHAITRFLERFAGNLSWNAAQVRLRKLLCRARFLRVQPGGGRLYGLGQMRFLVCSGMLLTVYRPTYRQAEAVDDLWFST